MIILLLIISMISWKSWAANLFVTVINAFPSLDRIAAVEKRTLQCAINQLKLNVLLKILFNVDDVSASFTVYRCGFHASNE